MRGQSVSMTEKPPGSSGDRGGDRVSFARGPSARWLICLSLAVASTALVAAPASADHNPGPWQDYPVRGCSWNQHPNFYLYPAFSTVYPPAPDVIRDGVINSFRSRVYDAIQRWSPHYASAAPNPKGYFWLNDGNGANNLLFQASYPTAGGALGETAIARTIDSGVLVTFDRCPRNDLGNTRYTLSRTQIRWKTFNYWFTQDDTRRALWEACGADFTSSYTCQREYDVGSLVTHEIGHTFQLEHADSHQTAASRGCFRPSAPNGDPWQSTMCTALPKHRTEFRTPEVFDRDSLHEHIRYNNNVP